MLKQLDIGMVIGMKQAGMSNRAIHKAKGYDRQKNSQVWSDYNAALAQMKDPGADIKAVAIVDVIQLILPIFCLMRQPLTSDNRLGKQQDGLFRATADVVQN